MKTRQLKKAVNLTEKIKTNQIYFNFLKPITMTKKSEKIENQLNENAENLTSELNITDQETPDTRKELSAPFMEENPKKRKQLTDPVFFRFVDEESGDITNFKGYFVGVLENSKINNPLIFADETGCQWLLPANHTLKQIIKDLDTEVFTTMLEIEFLGKKTLKGGRNFNMYQIYAL